MKTEYDAEGRLVLRPPLTARQVRIAALLSDGYGHAEVAEMLGIAESTVSYHVEEGRRRIPGDLSATAKLVCWYRGASLEVLVPPAGAGLRRTMALAQKRAAQKTPAKV